MHSANPVDSGCANLAVGHAIQALAPIAAYVSAKQIVHEMGSVLYCPAGQSEQGVRGLKSSSMVPSAHSTQSSTDDPCEALYVPDGQIPAQKKSVGSTLYVPAGHDRHGVLLVRS